MHSDPENHSGRSVAFLGLAIAGFSVLCWFFPIDIWVSAHFYDAKTDTWPLGDQVPWWHIYHTVSVLSLSWTIGLLLWMALTSAAGQRKLRRRIGLVLCAWVLVPGVLINAVLKAHSGHSRPAELAVFGGQHEYSPPWQWHRPNAGQSFPSGHAAAGFFPLVLAFVSGWRYRLWWVVFGICSGGVVGAARVVAGGHFLSDVLWSGYLVWAGAWILAKVFQSKTLPTLQQDPPLPRSAYLWGGCLWLVATLIGVRLLWP